MQHNKPRDGSKPSQAKAVKKNRILKVLWTLLVVLALALTAFNRYFEQLSTTQPFLTHVLASSLSMATILWIVGFTVYTYKINQSSWHDD